MTNINPRLRVRIVCATAMRLRTQPYTHCPDLWTETSTQLNTLLPRRRPHGSPGGYFVDRAGDDAMLIPTVMAIADGAQVGKRKTRTVLLGICLVQQWNASRLMTEYKFHPALIISTREILTILDDSFAYFPLLDLCGSQWLIHLILPYAGARIFQNDQYRRL